jgi:hypothetical protein
MKQYFIRTTFALLLLIFHWNAWAATPAADSTAQKLEQLMKDSVVTITYDSGILNLKDNNSGKLYKYTEGPENSEGYAAIYYLFTSRPYLHIDANGVTNKDHNAILKGHAAWFNVQTKGGANSTSFKMADVAPYRCVKWEGKMAQVLIATNAQIQKIPEKTILLVLRPELEKPEFKYTIIHNDSTLTLGQFEAIKLDPKLAKPLVGYSLVIERTNGIVVDTIVATTKNRQGIKDTPLNDGKWVIKLDSIPSNAKKIHVEIICRKFSENGEIKTDKEKRDIDLSWERHFNLFLIGGIVLCVISVAMLTLQRFRKNGKQQKSKKNMPSTSDSSKPTSTPPTTEKNMSTTNNTINNTEKFQDQLSLLFKENDNIKRLSLEITHLKDEYTHFEKRKDEAEKRLIEIESLIRAKMEEIEKLKTRISNAINNKTAQNDSAEFGRRCKAMSDDIDALVKDLQNNGDSDLANKVLDLKKKLYITQNK